MNKYQKALLNLENLPFDEDGGVLVDYRTSVTYDENGDEEIFNVQETLSTLHELIGKQEKYRWHNLMENPDDLPKLGEKVLCATGNKGGREVQIYRGSSINGYGRSLWEWKHNTVKTPVAWKYIEEFEDE